MTTDDRSAGTIPQSQPPAACLVEEVATEKPAERPNTSSLSPSRSNGSGAPPPRLLHDPALLQTIAATMSRRGFAGDTKPPLTAYVAMTSRLLERPLCLAFVAPSAAGKNRAVDAAAELVPAAALHVIHAGSERVLIYGKQDLQHVVVVFSEADSIPDEGAAASAIRSLISEGSMNYQVVEKTTEGRFETRVVHRPGPTGLITTSTTRISHQLGTRLLEVHISDDEQQTSAYSGPS